MFVIQRLGSGKSEASVIVDAAVVLAKRLYLLHRYPEKIFWPDPIEKYPSVIFLKSFPSKKPHRTKWRHTNGVAPFVLWWGIAIGSFEKTEAVIPDLFPIVADMIYCIE